MGKNQSTRSAGYLIAAQLQQQAFGQDRVAVFAALRLSTHRVMRWLSMSVPKESESAQSL
ncbi:MAG: hypothetical protein ACREYE_00900 [Gammaproteobacteria bacterium]